jgi:hypothetical protein
VLRTLPVILVAWAFTAIARADDPLVKDLRGRGSTSSLSVALCARPGVPGHAMVILGKDDETKKVCTVQAFGYYPTKRLKAILGSVPGKLADEFLQGSGIGGSACRIIVRVDQPLFEKVEAVRKKWAAKKDYKLLEADCVTFTSEVGKILGLKLPDREDAKLPVTFIKKLYELNK